MENREQKGQILKQAREAKGLSLESVHVATKIPMDILRALEEGYTVRTLTSFYYRGFVKIYAKHLGIDLAIVLDDKLDQPAEPLKPSRLTITRPPRFQGNPKITRYIIQAAVVLLALFVFTKSCTFLKNKIKNRKPRATISSEEIQKPKPKKEIVPVHSSRSAVDRSAERTENTNVEDVAVRTQREIPAMTAVSDPAGGVQKQPKTITLTVKAGRNSWLKVLSDGEVVFQGTLSKGGLETWMAKDNLEISGKYLNLLEFEFNGKIIGPLGKENRQVKKVVFTKDGLSVQK